MIAADHRIPEFVFFRTSVDLWGHAFLAPLLETRLPFIDQDLSIC